MSKQNYIFTSFEDEFLQSVWRQIMIKDFIVRPSLEKLHRYLKRAEEIAEKYGEEWGDV